MYRDKNKHFKIKLLAIYNHNFSLGQLVVVANQPDKIDEYVFKKNEVKLLVGFYNKFTG